MKYQGFPASPAQKAGLRMLLDEIRDEEISVARMRHRAALLRTGTHPQQQLIEAMLGLGFALHDNYGPGRGSQPNSDGVKDGDG